MNPEIGRPEYEVLWRQARKAVQRGQVKLGYKAPTPRAAAVVSELLGRAVEAGVGTTIVVSELDSLVLARFGLGLPEVLARVHGEPAAFNPEQPSVDAARRAWTDEILLRCLDAAGLAGAGWAPTWVNQVRRYAKIAPERLEAPARQAAAVLALLHLDRATPPARWWSRAELAGRTGDPAAMDAGSRTADLVLRAAALAHGVPHPHRGQERRLWVRCGVVDDLLSSTVLCANLAGRASPTHLPLREARDGDLAVAPGTLVTVCAHPRLVELAAALGAPLVCVSAHLNPAARVLLSRLAAAGARIRHHADLDPAGLLLTREIAAMTGGTPWRMTAADYRAALEAAHRDGIDLPPLDDEPGPTPWDPELPSAMRAGWAVPEENVLQVLLADLRAE